MGRGDQAETADFLSLFLRHSVSNSYGSDVTIGDDTVIFHVVSRSISAARMRAVLVLDWSWGGCFSGLGLAFNCPILVALPNSVCGLGNGVSSESCRAFRVGEGCAVYRLRAECARRDLY